jgi:hypothetical protein
VSLLTGYYPDAGLLTRAGVRCDPVTLAPEVSPETFETDVPNLSPAGGAIAGQGDRQRLHRETARFRGD